MSIPNNFGIVFFGVFLVFTISSNFLFIGNARMSKHPFFNIRNNGEVLVIAHRGGMGLSPENTLYAFKRAEELGVDVIELDIHGTRDGEIVIMHDNTIDRTTDGSGKVVNFTLTELKGFDAGFKWTPDNGISFPYRRKGLKMPTLSEVFSEIRNTAMIIEIKQSEPSLIDPLCQLIRKHSLEHNVIVASFSTHALMEFRRVCPEVATSATKTEAIRFFILNLFYLGGFYRPSAVALQVPVYLEGIKVVTKRFVNTAQKHNMEVHVWTVNEVDEMRRMINMGVNAIVTDYPDRLLRLLGRSEKKN